MMKELTKQGWGGVLWGGGVGVLVGGGVCVVGWGGGGGF